MSTFQNAIQFFVELGVYDVVLPFLLVFTIVFAMLEKTKVFGFDDKEKGETKKNLNAMVAFVTAFLVIASTELVRVVNTVMANTVLLLLLSVLFLMLAGSFHKDEEFELSDKWRKTFMGIMFVGIVLIFLHALGWLQYVWTFMVYNIDGPIVGSFFMLIIVIAGIAWLTGDSSDKGKDKSKDK